MKRRTTPVLEVTFDIPTETIAKVLFVFKQECEETAEAILEKAYPGDVSESGGVFKIQFTKEETALFVGGSDFYMDTMITDQAGRIPQTPIVRLFMSKTLFSEKEVSE